MNGSWIVALGLMLLLEGAVPFFFPRQWRETFSRLLRLSDGQIRFVGLATLLSGAAILALVHLLS
ncbi:DUF2065 domain-containing protein [Noviherbaspirillum massiliense]|uniref:DUF2065 domain-containing protein n=1 Tax=Noviherbaspirillum massiliense TaxID=1465823 RepID=UPI0009469EC6|nr:DUF2065 domain-containing protein [Noviherbaspirillum massiliense]